MAHPTPSPDAFKPTDSGPGQGVAGPTGSDSRVGSRLGKYLLVRPLGQGGMGMVYEARDTILDRLVAVKLLPDELASDVGSLRRFLAEARAAARLQHPHVVAVHEADVSEGRPYLVMELVKGGSAADRLAAAGPFAWREATRLAADACRGLAAAHAAGLLHRDIKPGNLLLGEGGGKLADFGVAKALDRAGTSLTVTGQVPGTPDDMCPEQCRAEPLDARSDVYSLAAAYYSLLTGRPPFEVAGRMEVMFAHCSRPAPDPRATDPAIPEACAALVRRAMAKSPLDRPAAAAELLADLDALLDAPTTAPPLVRLRPPARRSRRWVIAAAPVVFVGVLVGVVAFRWPRPPAAPPAVPPEESPALRSRAVLAGHPGGARAVAYSPDPNGHLLATAGNDGHVRLWDTVTATSRADLRGHRGAALAVAFSPDGKKLASGGEDTTVSLWDVTSQEQHTWRAHTSSVSAVAFSPDGEDLASAGLDRDVLLWNLGGTIDKARLRLKHVDSVLAMAYLPGTKTLATVSWDKAVRLWDTVGSGKELARADLVNEGAMCLAVSPDGRRVACGNLQSDLRVWAWDGQTLTILTTWPREETDPVYCVTFAPGGRPLLYAGGLSGEVRLRELNGGRQRRATTGVAGRLRALAFSPDGKTLASASEAGEVRQWDVVTAEGR
jgi:WD40 repeat protein